eukprot:scaffold7829_cov68-Attheya_sp.AAC.1
MRFHADDAEDEEEEDKLVNPYADPNYLKAKKIAKNFIKKKCSRSPASKIDQAAKNEADYFHTWKKQQSQK